MKPLTRQIAICGLLGIAVLALIGGFFMGKGAEEVTVQIALAMIGIVDSVVIGILALMQGKDSAV